MAIKYNYAISGVYRSQSVHEIWEAYSEKQAKFFFRTNYGFNVRVISIRLINEVKKEEEITMAKNNFYGVKVGRKVGVYESWSECEEQVKGFPGAKYKGFPFAADATMYVFGTEKCIETNEHVIPDFRVTDETNPINNYAPGVHYFTTDGTFLKRNYGGSFIYHIGANEIDRRGFKGDEAEYVEGRNHTGELSAAMRAVQFAITKGLSEFKIRHDYLGVANYITGEWKPRADSSIAYKQWMDNIIKKHNLKIIFIHVPGHSGDKFNEAADKLATLTMNS